MRAASCLAALISAGGSLGVTSGALAEVGSIVTASANAWDTRIGGYGCAPSGCVASNAVDASLEPDSRWSCKAQVSGVDFCELTLVLDEPEDIAEVRIALWKGDVRIRAMNVFVDGEFMTTIQSSGQTDGYEPYKLSATQATTVMLRAVGTEDNGWLSITGVLLMVDTELEVSPPSPTPATDGYAGCFNDFIDDRVMTSVMIDDDLTPEACASVCQARNDFFYALQQGNECWCAGCELTNFGTNTDYDRHGEGSCNTPCGGDPSITCGGDSALSLFRTTGVCSEEIIGTEIPANIASQIIADATGGFAGPGILSLDDDTNFSSEDYIIMNEDDEGTRQISGRFYDNDRPASIALFLYIDNDNLVDDFARGQGEIDASTGEFTATLTDVPNGISNVILSFVVLDPADTLFNQGPSSVFSRTLVHTECVSSVEITLTSNVRNGFLDLFVTEPGGTTVSWDNPIGDAGFYSLDRVGGGASPDIVVYNGLTTGVDALLGSYGVRAVYTESRTGVAWTLTAFINGEIVWVEEGVFEALSYWLAVSESDLFTVTLDSADLLSC